MKVEFIGNVGLVQYLSDSYYFLMVDLISTAKKYPQNLSFSAGAIIMGYLSIESYINELIYMTRFGEKEEENLRVKNIFQKYGANIVKKLKKLKAYSKNKSEILEETIEELGLFTNLRGFLVHFNVIEDYPNDPTFKNNLEELEKRIFGNNKLKGEVTLARILNPLFAEAIQKYVVALIKELYRAGYEPPRPRWVELIDPTRFGKKTI